MGIPSTAIRIIKISSLRIHVEVGMWTVSLCSGSDITLVWSVLSGVLIFRD